LKDHINHINAYYYIHDYSLNTTLFNIHMHGYLNSTCLFDPLKRENKDEVYLTLVRC
jgi:hypothetical protein